MLPSVFLLFCSIIIWFDRLQSDATSAPSFQRFSVVLLTNCQRDSVFTTLESLFGLPQVNSFAIYISMDCSHTENYRKDRILTEYVHLVDGFLNFPVELYDKELLEDINTRIALHLKFAIGTVFNSHSHSFVVIIEDDLMFSYDFLVLFLETAVLLEEDERILCVSAFHDIGTMYFSWQWDRLRRIEGFSGLGWMISREKWLKELQHVWPVAPLSGWDHWLRTYQKFHQLDCIVPEVSRSLHQHVHGSHLSVHEWQKKFDSILWSYNTSVESFGNLSGVRRKRDYENWLKSHLLFAVQKDTFSKFSLYGNLTSSVMAIAPKGQSEKRFWRHWFRQLKIPLNTQIQSFYEGVLSLPCNNHNIILVNNDSSLLQHGSNDTMGFFPAFRIIRAPTNWSCDQACENVFQGRRHCHPHLLTQIDSCHLLSQYFQCSRGCDHSPSLWTPGCLLSKQENQKGCLCAVYNQLSSDHSYSCRKRSHLVRRLCACQ